MSAAGIPQCENLQKKNTFRNTIFLGTSRTKTGLESSLPWVRATGVEFEFKLKFWLNMKTKLVGSISLPGST